MAREKAPAFQFYPRDFVADFDVAVMTLEQSGAYAVLLAYAWLKDGLPDDLPRLARALHVSGKRFDAIWVEVGQKFERAEDGRLRNRRQEKERAKQVEDRLSGAQGGKASAATRRGRFGSPNPRANREPKREGVYEPPPSQTLHNVRQANVNSATASATAVQKEREADTSSPPAFSETWNALTTLPLPRCREVTPTRKAKIRARLKERPLEVWREIFLRIEASRFCRGENDRGWKASFDWVIENTDNSVKVLEGKYDDAPAPDRASTGHWYDRCHHDPPCTALPYHELKIAQEQAALETTV